jgi:hypothetical protein
VFAIRQFRRRFLLLTVAKIRACSKAAGAFASFSINPVGKAGDDWPLALPDLCYVLLVLANTLSAVLGCANRQARGSAWLRRRQCRSKQAGSLISPGGRSAACGAIDVRYAATDH